MDKMLKKERSELMSKIKTKGTDIEKELIKLLRKVGSNVKFKKNSKFLPGKPDLVLPENKIVIFADGDFWHGKNFKIWGKTTSLFWQVKIQSNIKRDKKVNKLLKSMGYKVLRVWGSDIRKNKIKVQKKIEKALQ